MMKGQYFLFIIVAILLQSSGGIFGKYAALSLYAPSLIGIVTNIFYIFCLICLLFQAIVWQQALIHYPLSFAYPFMSLYNFVILMASVILFNEGITFSNIIGLGIISGGIAIFSSSGKGLFRS